MNEPLKLDKTSVVSSKPYLQAVPVGSNKEKIFKIYPNALRQLTVR